MKVTCIVELSRSQKIFLHDESESYEGQRHTRPCFDVMWPFLTPITANEV